MVEAMHQTNTKWVAFPKDPPSKDLHNGGIINVPQLTVRRYQHHVQTLLSLHFHVYWEWTDRMSKVVDNPEFACAHQCEFIMKTLPPYRGIT